MSDARENELYPFHVFRFLVEFTEARLQGSSGGPMPLCSGAFSECTGLEATMEPKVIKVGGQNYGPSQRVGPVTFATVILKRGMTSTRDVWKWFSMATSKGKYTYRLSVKITLQDHSGEPVMAFKLDRALPVKFKSADLSAKGTEVGIEELHLAHEGLTIESIPRKS